MGVTHASGAIGRVRIQTTAARPARVVRCRWLSTRSLSRTSSTRRDRAVEGLRPGERYQFFIGEAVRRLKERLPHHPLGRMLSSAHLVDRATFRTTGPSATNSADQRNSLRPGCGTGCDWNSTRNAFPLYRARSTEVGTETDHRRGRPRDRPHLGISLTPATVSLTSRKPDVNVREMEPPVRGPGVISIGWDVTDKFTDRFLTRIRCNGRPRAVSNRKIIGLRRLRFTRLVSTSRPACPAVDRPRHPSRPAPRTPPR